MTDMVDGDVQGIAIIGMAGRFPRAPDVPSYWENIRDGVDCIARFSAEEMAAEGVDPGVLSMPGHVNAHGVLDGVELFDAGFFGFTPREAEITDPQQRLFLECAWEALEDAGCDPTRYEGQIGVFAGSLMSRYLFQIFSRPDVVESAGGYQLILANDKDHISTRTSYKLNLRGPSVTVQTTCSTSLVATCMACNSLSAYDCDVALAGAASILLPQHSGYVFVEGGISSPDGVCRAFDAEARGTVGGNGVGVVLLKRLADALADGDRIHAVIKGWAVNNDGSAKAGYTAPSVDGQAEVIAMAQAVAGVAPETVSYVETHGTGTVVGDPIEIEALTQAFRKGTDRCGFCAIGSVKTNVGHLDPAAGAAGLIKTALALEHRQLPPSLHFSAPNPLIDFDSTPFYVNAELKDWPGGAAPRRAGVSSFGIGGTNAHIVLEEPPDDEPGDPGRPWQLMLVSTRTEARLEAAADRLAGHLEGAPDDAAADVAYTTQVGRKAFAHRLAAVVPARDAAGAARALRDRVGVTTAAAAASPPPVVFLFPGQGAQYGGMAAQLYGVEPTFAAALDRSAELLRPELGLDLRELLFAADRAAASERLQQTSLTQPVLFAVEHALAELWMSWGVRPAAMIGHSIGEYVAACLAGVLRLEDALALVAARGRLMQAAPEGTMIAVPLSEQAVAPHLLAGQAIAVVSGPELSVVAGPPDEARALEAALGERGIACTRLRTSHAFHSPMMDGVVEPFRERAQQTPLHAPALPYISNVTGTWIAPDEATDPAYWAAQLRRTVRLHDGLRELAAGYATFLEVGPGASLAGLVGATARGGPPLELLASLPAARDGRQDLEVLYGSLARLWACGAAIDWDAVHAPERRRKLRLPTYPFERQRYWVDPQGSSAPVPEPAPGRHADLADWFWVPAWSRAPLDPSTADGSAHRLVFGDAAGLGEELARQARDRGEAVTLVMAGDSFAVRATDRYEVCPHSRADHEALLAALAELGDLPTAAVHLWSLDAGDSLERVGETEERSYLSLVAFVQALARGFPQHPFDMTVVTSDLHDIAGDEHPRPGGALVLGLCRVIPQEHPNLHCRSVDVSLEADGPAAIAGWIHAEASAATPAAAVAWRGGERWSHGYEPRRLERRDPPLRKGGVYLITGGLGGIGLTIAEHLARELGAKLVLTTRTPPSDRGDPDPRLAGVRRLEELGADVLVIGADASAREDMTRVVDAALDRFGALHGVVHAAGVPGDGLIQLRSADAARTVLAPKVQGTLVLEAVTARVPLDFVLLCSSLGSILGGVGQADYASANAFLGAFARSRALRRDGPRITALAWDVWQEVGMAVNTAVPRELEHSRRHNLRLGITCAEGVECFRRALASGVPELIVSTMDLRARVAAATAAVPAAPPAAAAPAPAAARYPRPDLTMPYVAPRSDTENAIAEVWAELLGVERVGVDDDFFELGGHSLLALQVISRLRETFLYEVSIEALMDEPTVARLARAVDASDSAERLGEMLALVEQLSEEELQALEQD